MADRTGGGDGSDLYEAVAEVMARIRSGDRTAVWDLHDLAEPALRGILRSEARRVNVWLSEDDVFDLTLDAAVDLAKLAAAWKADGALPWVWARRRVTALVHQHLGTFTRPLDDSCLEIEERPPPPPLEAPRQVLRSVARRHPAAQNLEERLRATVTERDAEIWLGVEIEKAAGNRSPAVTVGADHGLEPATVRKVAQRVRERLGEVA